MFKTDQKSLEEISFGLDERDISNFVSVIKYLKSKDLLTVSSQEYKEVMEGLKAIGKLKLNGKVYGFHVNDSFANKQGNKSAGVELYLRQGDSLKEYFSYWSRDSIYSAEDAAKFLKKQKISTIYTGEIPESGFLGLDAESDPEDPIMRSTLDEGDKEELESAGIQVIRLDLLI